MGISRLMDLLKKKAPNCIKKAHIEHLKGYTIACDASIAMHQFLNAKNQGNGFYTLRYLTDKEGNCTGHLVGILNRTIKFLQNGIKPIWVFDGRSPYMKFVAKTIKDRQESEEGQLSAEDIELINELGQICEYEVIKPLITRQMYKDCKTLLRLIGVPVIQAPSEAEAQCAALVKAGKANATMTEDMDALTFGSDLVLRDLNTKHNTLIEISLPQALQQLGLTYEEFVDFCILCGCDYTEHVKGLGPTTALKQIKEYENIEGVLENLKVDTSKRKNKPSVPEFFNYQEARKLFINPEVIDDVSSLELEWNKPDEKSLKDFLVAGKDFADWRVENTIMKLNAYHSQRNAGGSRSLLENSMDTKFEKEAITNVIKKVYLKS